MEKLGYDKVEIDGLGNVIGWMGQGEKIIAIGSGAEPWQLMPFTSTRISMRPRWPR